MTVSNVNVYGLDNAIRCSKFPMATDSNKCNTELGKNTVQLFNAAPGTGHDQALTGIIVQFDLTFSLKAWTELQRYHFVDFISSQSTMHRIAKFDISQQCNEWVDKGILDTLKLLVFKYNEEPTPANYLTLLYNIPTGFQLTAGLTTNYRQLKTIYYQRRNHRLPEWREFCKWIETLPRFKEFCISNVDND